MRRPTTAPASRRTGERQRRASRYRAITTPSSNGATWAPTPNGGHVRSIAKGSGRRRDRGSSERLRAGSTRSNIVAVSASVEPPPSRRRPRAPSSTVNRAFQKISSTRLNGPTARRFGRATRLRQARSSHPAPRGAALPGHRAQPQPIEPSQCGLKRAPDIKLPPKIKNVVSPSLRGAVRHFHRTHSTTAT